MKVSPQLLPRDLHDWKRDYAIWLPIMLLVWVAGFAWHDPFITDWDAYDYAIEVVRGEPGVLGLGRALFLAYNRLLWLIGHGLFGILPEYAYLIIRNGVIAQTGITILGFYALYKEFTSDNLITGAATLLVALSPLYIIYSGRGMSEIPGLLMFSWSFWWVLRSARQRHATQYLLATLVFGLSANMREFALFYLPTILLAGRLYGLRLSLLLIALILVGLGISAGMVCWMLYRPAYMAALISWNKLLAVERHEFPFMWWNVAICVAYTVFCSPISVVTFPFAVRMLVGKIFASVATQDKQQTISQGLMLLTGVLGAIAVGMLLMTHDFLTNPRYLLLGLPGLALLGGWGLTEIYRHYQRWHAWLLAAIVMLTLVDLYGMNVFLQHFQWPKAYQALSYTVKLNELPSNAVFIVGRYTPLVYYYSEIGVQPGWAVIPAGAAWPHEELGDVIDQYLSKDLPVYVDFDEALWRATARDHAPEMSGLAMIRHSYKLEWIRDDMYRIAGR